MSERGSSHPPKPSDGSDNRGPAPGAHSPSYEELVRMTEQLAQRQEAFEQAMEIAGETFWDWNLLTNEMGHARNRARMLGYADGELGQHLDRWVDLSHPDDQEPVAKLIRAHIRGETPEYEAEYRQRHRDGHWIWVRSRGRVVERDPDTGKPTRMRGTVVDITRRKELEARIAQLNEDLLQLVRSLPDAVLHMDVEGRWIFANDRARVLFAGREGDGPDEADRQAWERRAAQVTLETHRIAEQHREYEVQRVPIFDAAGQPKALVLIARDLWHQREQEDILRRALEQAEEAARSKTQFLATMAHEIRTPLNSVLGAARLALMEEEPAQVAQHLELVHHAAEMLLDLLNTVLDHSRLESGLLPIERAPVSVRQLIHQVAQQMSPAARAKGLQWLTRVDPAVPPMVLGDHIRLKQVLTNLVGNAVKFTDNGSIELRASVEPAVSDEQPTMVSIAITDTGIGLTPEQQARLFKAFSQADATIARRYGGTGLGLSISRQLMQAMGGSLTLQSERGKGSTFVLSWPLQPVFGAFNQDDVGSAGRAADAAGGVGAGDVSGAAQSPGTEMARQLAQAGLELVGRRVLVVDDNRMNVAVVRRLLERAGLVVTSASSGSEALSVLKSTSVDLVLLDLYMPEMNGDEVARRIRTELGLHRLPLIAFSASVTMEERERCAAAGMDEFVSKPIEPLELLSAMADCLQP
jgi:two-component system sensor histidine kinase/response regulator